MARDNTATLDGVLVGYGTLNTHNVETGNVHTKGRVKQLEVRIDHSTLLDLAVAIVPTSKNEFIPAGSTIVRSTFTVLEAFADLTTLDIGTKGSDGVIEDEDGLHDAVALTEIDAIGDVHIGDGAQIGNISNTDEDLYISLDITGTDPTAGEAILLVEFIEPVPSSEAPDPISGVIGSL